MLFTKKFVMDEIVQTRKLVEEVYDELIEESPSLTGFLVPTPNGEKLHRVLFKLDVICTAVDNIDT